MFRVRVDLENSKPPIWRRLDVRSDIGLDLVHQVLQAVFGWTDSHLHRFALGGDPFSRSSELFLCPYDAEEGEDEGTPAKDVTLDETLAERGDVLRYCYDYGDSWDLVIVLESVRPLGGSAPVAVCVGGRRAAPPEDCGGLRDAEDLAEVLDDPAHFDLDETNQTLDDPYLVMRESGVDPRLVEIVDRLRDTGVGDDLVLRVRSLTADRSKVPPEEKAAALHPFLWFLDHVGEDGLQLTSAGYLKPVDVSAAAGVLPAMADWIGAANRESQTFPVLWFRESLQKLGLLRKYRGRILLTKAGSALRGNPDALWRYIAARLPLGKPDSMDVPAGLLLLLVSGSTPGARPSPERLAQALSQLGWRHSDRTPVSSDIVRWTTADTLLVLENVTIGPLGRGARHQISDVAAALACDALLMTGD